MIDTPLQPASVPSREGRRFDIVLYGATGFTGGLVADYLVRNLPAGSSWALAGRSEDKLRAVAERLAAEHPEGVRPGIVVADSSHPDTLQEMAADARVVITTVGPYLEYGEPLVHACATAGTDYVDLAGEPEFVDLMYLRHHAEAEASGARIVHACGFDSIPHDLGVFYTVRHLPEGSPTSVLGAVHADASFSGGTFHSAIGQFSRLRQASAIAQQRRKEQGRPAGGRRVRYVSGKLHKDPTLDRWLAPLPTIDPQIVLRSASALERYGPDFSYSHYVSLSSPLVAVGGVVGVGAIALGVQVPFVKEQLLKRIDRGEGPSERRRARSSFDVTFVGRAADRTAVTRVSGGDPGYTETSMMLAESAMCLAFDNVTCPGGQRTTAEAMGEPLLARVERGGLTFEVLEG